LEIGWDANPAFAHARGSWDWHPGLRIASLRLPIWCMA
jgi:hypothetical protein